MQRAKLIKAGKQVLRFGLPAVILVFLFFYVQRNWNDLAAHKFQLNPWLLALALLGFLLQELSFGIIWRMVLARLSYRLDLRTSLRIYLASEFVRYIPGNVWHVLTRILWVGKYGVPRPIAFASMTIELITKLAAGALIFAISLLFWGDVGLVGKLLNGSPLVVALGLVTIGALLVGLHPRVLGGMLNGALRLVKRSPVELTLRYRDILLVTLAWCASWLVAGTAFYVLLLALWPAAPPIALPICIGIEAMAWDIGFLSFITPSGLGFREGAVVGLFALSLPLPLGIAAILALLWRLISTLAELICIGIAYVSGGRQVRSIQQEQLDQQLADSTVKKNETGNTLSDEPSPIGVEGGVGRD